MIGSGVFMLPASLAPYGWNAIAGWVISICGALAIALTMAALARRFPESGSPADYIGTAFGAVAGFLIGWSFLASNWPSIAALAAAAASYFSPFAPGLTAHPTLASLAFLAAVTVVNLVGLRTASMFQIATTGLKLVPLLIVILLVARLAGSNLPPPILPLPTQGLSLSAMATAGAITLFALLGFETLTGLTDRVKQPERTVPRALVSGTLFVGLLYLVVCSAILLLMPPAQLAASHAPFADFVQWQWGDLPAQIVAVLAGVSAVGAMNGFLMFCGEFPAAMARRGLFPRWFAHRNAAGTPVRSILLSSAISAALILSTASPTLGGLFNAMALLTTSTALWLYLACALAALKFRLAIPAAILSVGFSAWTLIGAGVGTSLLSIVLMLAGLPLFWRARTEARSKAVSIIVGEANRSDWP